MSKKAQTLSFVGGLVFVTTIATVLIVKNEKLRKEVEYQISGLLKTSKNVIGQVQFVTEKISNLAGGSHADKDASILADKNNQASVDDYDLLWTKVEQQNRMNS